MKPYKKILIIQTAFFGDAILTSPLIREVRKRFPQAQIDLIANSGAMDLFSRNPNIDAVFPFVKKPFVNKILGFLKLLIQIRREKYECAISVQSYMTSANLMFFAGIPRRIGFKRQKLLTDPIIHGGLMHRTEYYLSLMKAFSDEKYDRQTEIFWSEDEEKKAVALFESIGNKKAFNLGIAPGSVWFTKRWPKEYFVELIDKLQSESIQIFLIGGPGEVELCAEIEKKCVNKNVTNIGGQHSITGSAAVIKKLDLMLVNDSAPLHIANAVQTDVIAIFGPTVRRYGFYPLRENDTMLELELPCRPCRHNGGPVCPEKHFKCMLELQPAMVLQAIRKYYPKEKSTD
ncbi:MAG: lipopolysaccharide heptosyltransferase II [Calditrichaeota bacterium]|nr:MAG: lipopolysaccharide heptosyltransferase II [Calditrichota bacterium]